MNTIASTILRQLGGHRFVIMTGAKCIETERSLICYLPKGRIATIELQPSDTYRLRYGKVASKRAVFEGKPVIRWDADHDDVYEDALPEVFSRVSGLAVAL